MHAKRLTNYLVTEQHSTCLAILGKKKIEGLLVTLEEAIYLQQQVGVNGYRGLA